MPPYGCACSAMSTWTIQLKRDSATELQHPRSRIQVHIHMCIDALVPSVTYSMGSMSMVLGILV